MSRLGKIVYAVLNAPIWFLGWIHCCMYGHFWLYKGSKFGKSYWVCNKCGADKCMKD